MRRLCCFELSNKRQGILENLGPHLNPKLYCKSLGLMATSKASSHLRRKYVGAKQKKLVKQEVPILEDKHTVHEE